MSDITDTELLLMATAFQVLPLDYKRIGPRQIVVERMSFGDHPEAWAITDGSTTLNKLGEWECQPFPSSRTKSYFKRCRWPTAQKAIEFAQKYLKKNPPQYFENIRVDHCA